MKKWFLILWFVWIPAKALSAQELLIFGGRGHHVFLGCLNCSRYDESSIWNPYGDFGSRYNEHSIWNRYGDYGSRYSDYSPWNPYADYPPVVVDEEGNFYGYLTLNAYHDKRAEFDLALILYRHYEEIREDPAEWYERIFE
ncbi:MAG: hypothetical protein GXO24_03355 [Chlorobi bacterium]|nr:hypothetical protein [Chlorobiota bacterium]